jgi:hypothetical protein
MAAITGVGAGAAQTGSGGAPRVKGGRGDINLTVEAGAVVINGVDATNAGGLVEEAFSLLLDRLALKAGL